MYDEIVDKYYNEIYNYCCTKLNFSRTAAEGCYTGSILCIV